MTSTVPDTQQAFNRYLVDKWMRLIPGRQGPLGTLNHLEYTKLMDKGQWRPTELKSDPNSTADSCVSLGKLPNLSEHYLHLQNGSRAPIFPGCNWTNEAGRACVPVLRTPPHSVTAC